MMIFGDSDWLMQRTTSNISVQHTAYGGHEMKLSIVDSWKWQNGSMSSVDVEVDL